MRSRALWLLPAALVGLSAWVLRRPRRLDRPHPHRPLPRLSDLYRWAGASPVEAEPDDLNWERGEIAA